MRLAVTRPMPDAERQAEALRERGHEVLVEPLLRVEFLDSGALSVSGVQALIATSRNGLRALARNDALAQAKALPLFAVGSATAAMGRALGFSAVVEGDGTAAALVSLVAEQCDAQDGALLHLAGERLAADLKGDLEGLGFNVLQPRLYRTMEAQSLSGEMEEAITSGALDGVLLMSPATAHTWARLVLGSKFYRGGDTIRYFCLSQSVADGLAGLGEAEILVAETPQEDRLLALVARKTAH